jgi:hypothetical protein
MSKEAILSTAYLGPVQYFSKFLIYDKIWIEAEENYQKQSYRNRCVILTSNGRLGLSIPVTKDKPKTKTKDIRIDHSVDWQKDHWNAIESAYSASPFFEFFVDDFLPFFQKKYTYLLDFNTELLEMVINHLEIDVEIEFTNSFEHNPEGLEDFRNTIHPKPRVSVEDPDFSPSPYYQVFYDRFEFFPNLSIIDLLFCEGPNAENILCKSSG